MKVVLKKSEAAEPFTFAFVEDGKTVVRSENYKAKSSALNGIESVRKNSQVDTRYELKASKSGKFFFNVKATNGQIVATSTMFSTEADRDAAIASLKAHAPSAELEEA